MAAGLDGVRSDDTNTLKYRMLGWVMKDPSEAMTPAIPAGLSSKDLRGFNNATLAGLMCPLEWAATQECVRSTCKM
jgi:hypothetical protein